LIADSVQKTGKVITIEDHSLNSGYALALSAFIAKHGLQAQIEHMGVREYQLSGKAEELYKKAGLGVDDIVKTIKKLSK